MLGFIFPLKAKGTKESDIIGREGPVGIGQPGVVRAPSGFLTDAPVPSAPAGKGTLFLKMQSLFNTEGF